MIKEKAVQSMKQYFENQRYIDHTLKVLDYGERIFDGEAGKRVNLPGGFERDVVTLACIYHDIGIPEAVRTRGSSDAPHQEELGPDIARKLMGDIGVRSDLLERVLYIIGHHHTADRIDGEDFQVVWEADFLVNIQEGNITLEPGQVNEAVKRNLKTETGRALAAEVPQLSAS
jgi:HD superfamily phosphodiesterase